MDDPRKNPDYWLKVEEILAKVVDQPAEALDAAIAEATGADPELEAEVRSLLGHLPDPEASESEDETSRPDLDLEALGGRSFGEFALESYLGRGAHGVVYRGRQSRPDRSVAIKVIDTPGIGFRRARSEVLRRFEHEVAVISLLEHPGIARVIAAGIDGSTRHPLPYIVTDFVEDPRDLRTWWLDERDDDRRLDLLIQVADTVQAAHDVGILHRDLKPANILVTSEDRARIIDFGISTIAGADPRQEMAAGSAGYASPEQLDPGRPRSTVKSDVYALGRIIEVLLGEHVLSDRRRQADLRAIARQASATEPSDRYPTAAAFRADIERVRRHTPPDAANPGWWRRNLAAIRAHPVGNAVAALVVLVIAILVGLLVNSREDLVVAQQSLILENARLEATIEAEALARYATQLAALGQNDDDPLAARRALRAIDPDADDFAIRYLHGRLQQDLGAVYDKGVNAYRHRLVDDGTRIVSATADGAVHLHRIGENESERVFPLLGSQIYAVAAAPDGSRILAGLQDGRLVLLDPDRPDHECVIMIADDLGTVLGLAWHPGGRTAIAFDGGGDLREVTFEDGQFRMKTIPLGLKASWLSLDYDGTGSKLAACGVDGRVVVLDVDATTGNIDPTVAPRWTTVARLPRTVRWSPGSDRLAVVGGNTVTILDPELEVDRVHERIAETLWSLAWSPDARHLAVGGWDQTLRILDAETGEIQRRFLGGDGPIWTLSWPRPELIASGEENTVLRWWDVSPANADRWSIGDEVTGVVLADDGHLVASDRRGGLHQLLPDGTVRTIVPKIETVSRGGLDTQGYIRLAGDRLDRFGLDGTFEESIPLEFPADKSRLVQDLDLGLVGGAIGDQLVIIELGSGEVIATEPHDGWTGNDPAFTPDGALLVPVGHRSGLDGLLLLEPDRPIRLAFDAAHPNGNLRSGMNIGDDWCYASHTDDSFSVVIDGQERIDIDLAHAGGVNDFAAVDDGRTLLTAGGDGRLRCWSLPTVTPLLSVRIPMLSSIRVMEVIDEDTIALGDVEGTIVLISALAERP